MKENSIRQAVREGRPALGTGLKEFASRGVPWIIEASGFDYCMIDHEHGASDLEAIAAWEGIDMIACGHSDLSARLCVHLQLEHPTFKAAVRRIAQACNAHGKLARGSAEAEAQIEDHWRLGCKVLNLPGTDVSTYLDGLKARASRAHARLKSIGVRAIA
jgi:4-hydroxy-2-oxoheptanedioate aldolase